MNRTDRAMQQLCKDVIVLDSDEDEAPSLSDMARRASEILGWLAPKRRPSLPRHSAVAKAEARRQQKKESRRERVAAIREAVFDLWGGSCPLCLNGTALVPEPWSADDLHHLLSGGGTRRAEESVRTCLPVCREHHRALHRNDLDSLRMMLEVVNDPDVDISDAAIVALERRIAKVAEARRSGAEGDGRRDR